MAKWTAIAFIALLGCGLCVAQQTKETDGKKAEEKTAQSWTPPSPSPEIKKLSQALSGYWSGAGTEEDSPFSPGGDSATGTNAIRPGPGGMSVIATLRLKFKKMGAFSGMAVLYWDAKDNAYKGTWCDSASPTCVPAGTGRWDGDKLVFDGEADMNGTKMKTRETYSDITRTGFTWTMDMAEPGGQLKRAMTFKYKRAGAASPESARQ